MFRFITTAVQDFIRYLSFDQSDYLLCKKINEKVPLPHSENLPKAAHPLGFISQFYDTKISLVHLYASIIYGIKSPDISERMAALKLLSDQYRSDSEAPQSVNLVRLRLFLMKRTVENTDNFYEQMKNLRDFQKTFFLSKRRLTKFLHRFNLICTHDPCQAGKSSCAFDAHILDNTNAQDRTFTTLLTDMFITGICEAALVCRNLPSKEACQEICEAADFLKIKLRIAVPFDIYQDGYACRYLGILPYIRGGKRFLKFYSKHQITLEAFRNILQERQSARSDAVRRCIDNFNEYHLDNLNQHYSPEQPLYYLPKLTMEEICGYYGQNTLTHIHLGDFLYRHYKRILFNRLRFMQYSQKFQQKQRGKVPQWDQNLFRSRYEQLLHEYHNLTPYILIRRYFADLIPERFIPSDTDLASISEKFHYMGGYIRFIPSGNLDKNAYHFLFKRDAGLIDQVEVYSLCDSNNKPLEEIVSFAQFIQDYNKEAAASEGKIHIVEPVCSSYSLNSGYAPFMGFVFSDKKIKHLKTWAVPPLISSMIYLKGKPADAEIDSKTLPALYHLDHSLQENKEETKFSFWQKITHSLSYIHPKFCRGLLLSAGFLAVTASVSPLLGLIFLILCAIYTVTAESAATKHNIRENQPLNKDRTALILFSAGISIPVLQNIFDFFNKDFFYTIHPLPLTFFRVFCLSAFLLSALLFYAKIMHIPQKNLKNFIISLILSWPLASITVTYIPQIKIPEAMQSLMWIFILGLLGLLPAVINKEKGKQQKIMEEVLETFDKCEEINRPIPVLDLMYLLVRQPALRSYWKDLCRETSVPRQSSEQINKDKKELHNLCLRIKEWCTDKQHYRQILEVLLTHYTDRRVDLIFSSTVKYWPVFIKFIMKY